MHIQIGIAALAASLVAAVPPVEIQGNEFVNTKTGDKFQIAGMAYQPGGSAAFNDTNPDDPLGHPDACLRDAALMQVLGVNAIRVYNLHPDVNHDECASIFNAAGIYMLIDVNAPGTANSLTSWHPWESYYEKYVNRTFAVVEAFSNYPNTLLFFSGNEVIDKVESAEFVPQYLRAITRDLKNYIKKNIKHKFPVGYAAADVRPILMDTFNYLACAEDGKESDMTRADIFALNSYSWCSINATYDSSTYSELTSDFSKSPIPVFFSEYGCIEPKPRYWNETRAMYSSKMAPTFSGGIVYEWTEEANGYGLTSLENQTLSIMGDYNRLKDVWAGLDWNSIQGEKANKSDVSFATCDTKLVTEKGFDTNFTAPAPPDDVQSLIDNGIKNKPVGKIVNISDYNVKLTVKDSEGKEIKGLKVVPLPDDEFNMPGKNKLGTGSSDPSQNKNDNTTSSGNSDNKKDDDSSGSLLRPLVWAGVVPVVLAMFA